MTVKTRGSRGRGPIGPRCLLVDLDDTLFDHVRASYRSLARFRLAYPALRRWTKGELARRHAAHLHAIHPKVLSGELTIGAARAERMRRLFAEVGEALPGWEAERRSVELRRLYQAVRGAVPGARTFLRFAHRRVRVVIVSNNLLAEQQGKLRLLRLRPFVDDLVTSEELGLAKPDPAMFRAALDRNGCRAEEAVMLGDSFESDIAGAVAAGIPTVWFNRFGSTVTPAIAGIPQIASLVPASAAWAACVRAWASAGAPGSEDPGPRRGLLVAPRSDPRPWTRSKRSRTTSDRA